MPKDFRDLNAVEFFAEDFSQNPNRKTAHSADLMGFAWPHPPKAPIACGDHMLCQTIPVTGRTATKAHSPANQRFTLIRQDARNQTLPAGAKDATASLSRQLVPSSLFQTQTSGAMTVPVSARAMRLSPQMECVQ